MTRRITTLAFALVLLAAAAAEAGQYHGAIASSSGSVITCGPPEWTVTQGTGGSHQIGSGGIVTKWFTFAGSAGGQTRLTILRGTDPNYTVVGESTMENIAAGVNAFVTRIPVQAGDRVAVTASGGPCMFITTNAHSIRYCIGCNNGSAVTTTDGDAERQVNARVSVEQDNDGDGWGDESQDNCQGLANPAQANADGDGSGDDCDIDDDNDSAPDSEDALPLDARDSRDTDADGVGDNVDSDDDNDGVSDVDEARAGSDPRNAGSRPSIPGSELRPDLVSLPPEGGLAAPVLRSPASVSLARLRKGINVAAITETPAELDFELRGTPKGARLARFELLLASRSLGAGSGRRSVRLKPNRRWLRGARRFTLQLRVTATDVGGNRAVATRTIKVR